MVSPQSALFPATPGQFLCGLPVVPPPPSLLSAVQIHRIDKSLDATTMPDPDQSSGLDPIPFVEVRRPSRKAGPVGPQWFRWAKHVFFSLSMLACFILFFTPRILHFGVSNPFSVSILRPKAPACLRRPLCSSRGVWCGCTSSMASRGSFDPIPHPKTGPGGGGLRGYSGAFYMTDWRVCFPLIFFSFFVSFPLLFGRTEVSGPRQRPMDSLSCSPQCVSPNLYATRRNSTPLSAGFFYWCLSVHKVPNIWSELVMESNGWDNEPFRPIMFYLVSPVPVHDQNQISYIYRLLCSKSIFPSVIRLGIAAMLRVSGPVQYSSSPDRELFGHLLFDPNMVAHHTPFPYGIAPRLVFRRLKYRL